MIKKLIKLYFNFRAVSVPTTVIYFTCYDQLRDALVYKLGDNDYIPLIAGAIARCEFTNL